MAPGNRRFPLVLLMVALAIVGWYVYPIIGSDTRRVVTDGHSVVRDARDDPAGVGADSPPNPPPEPSEDIPSPIVDERIGGAEDTSSPPPSPPSPPPPADFLGSSSTLDSRRIVSAIALIAIERAIEEGRGYRAAWNLLDCCHRAPDSLAFLEGHSDGSIASDRDLERRLTRILAEGDVVHGGVHDGADGGSRTWWRRFITVERIDPRPRAKAPAALRSALDDLRAGRLEEAAAVVASLHRHGVAGLEEWLDRANRRLRARRALETLSRLLAEAREGR